MSRNFQQSGIADESIVVVVVVAAVLVLAGYISKKRKSPQALSPSQPCEDMQREQETICELGKDDLPLHLSAVPTQMKNKTKRKRSNPIQ